jgi:8-oxo-dGTP pyrophosphatase MutT (NUDIX family)
MMNATMFVLGVIAKDGTYLVVQERDGSWYLPAGRVEQGENLMAAMVRETIEEAGQLVGLHGLIAIDHGWQDGHTRLRFIFAGYPGILMPPKDTPDEHSRGAAWLSKADIGRLPLRDPEVLRWIEVWEAGTVLPCRAYEWSGPDGSARPFTGRSGRAV